jgi:hypothetical protein
MGIGHQNRIVLAPQIISRTLCKMCHGAGILPPKKPTTMGNTVMSEEMCKILTQA